MSHKWFLGNGVLKHLNSHLIAGNVQSCLMQLWFTWFIDCEPLSDTGFDLLSALHGWGASSCLICVCLNSSCLNLIHSNLQLDGYLKHAHFILRTSTHTSSYNYFCRYGEVCLLPVFHWKSTSSGSTHPYLRAEASPQRHRIIQKCNRKYSIWPRLLAFLSLCFSHTHTHTDTAFLIFKHFSEVDVAFVGREDFRHPTRRYSWTRSWTGPSTCDCSFLIKNVWRSYFRCRLCWNLKDQSVLLLLFLSLLTESSPQDLFGWPFGRLLCFIVPSWKISV